MNAVRQSRKQPHSEAQHAIELGNPLLQGIVESNWKNLSMGVKSKRYYHQLRKPLDWSHWKNIHGWKIITINWSLPSSLAALARDRSTRLDWCTLQVLLHSQGLWPRDRDCLRSKLALLIFLNKIKVNVQLCALAIWLWNYTTLPALWVQSTGAIHRGDHCQVRVESS